MEKQPIGMFDSGVGGLTIFKEIRKQFPYEDIIYFADTKNCPYGEKKEEQVINFSHQICQFLISQHCKLIIVACNTATAASIEKLRNTYSIPFIGIEPATKPAAIDTKTGHIGILATNGTFTSTLFHQTKEQFANHVSVHIQPAPELVSLAENGEIDTGEVEKIIAKLIQPFLNKNVDTIVLGCTHFPLFKPIIQKLFPERFLLIDTAEAIANRLQTINPIHETMIEGKSIFYASDHLARFRKSAQKILTMPDVIIKKKEL